MADGRWRFHNAPDQADIILFQRTAAENILQDFQRLRIPGKKTKAAGAVVQTMTGSGRESIWVFLPDISRTKIGQRHTAAGIFLHTDAGAFVDQENVIILIDNTERRDGTAGRTGVIRNIDLQRLTFMNRVVPGNPDAVQFDVTGRENPANHTFRNAGKDFAHIVTDTFSGIIRRNDDFFQRHTTVPVKCSGSASAGSGHAVPSERRAFHRSADR